ncbi:transglutaminase-like cysteine peptidase [Thiorhodovibrio litoralis]|uniref:transglutaminase-like cysteine peptidase n=1 Tax=Thiorhodovibrio litoralis TaxID=2952932 RepID=UPI002B25675B|nr:transglutaminase-like cysteine peptidase [Thiorhodovibrio litoralis]WPL11513.1 hypothetical protein Thiosp_01260 [Thiorhodovibrio litoralis]
MNFASMPPEPAPRSSSLCKPGRPPDRIRLHRRERWLMAAIIVAQCLMLSAAVAGGFDRGGIFGKTGKMFTNFRPIPQWPKLLERYRAEERKDRDCHSSGRGRCPYTEWTRTIERLRGKDKATQVREINRFANNWSYITDPVNWGKEDYWATPGEFFDKSGDCEDFAIVKFMSLRALGFSNAELRLVAVKDLNLKVGHSVTLVDLGGRIMLMDNQIKQVVQASTVRHYKPVFAANETTWWLFK